MLLQNLPILLLILSLKVRYLLDIIGEPAIIDRAPASTTKELCMKLFYNGPDQCRRRKQNLKSPQQDGGLLRQRHIRSVPGRVLHGDEQRLHGFQDQRVRGRLALPAVGHHDFDEIQHAQLKRQQLPARVLLRLFLGQLEKQRSTK